MRQQYVYVLHLPTVGRYKIGRTVNPDQRFVAMNLPEKPTVFGMIPCADANHVEWSMHKRFAGERRYGEWFELSLPQVAELLFWCRVLGVGDMECDEAATGLVQTALARRVRKRTGKAPARVYSMRRK